MKIVSASRTRSEETPANFPKCRLCGSAYQIVSHYGPRGALQSTSAECLECQEVVVAANINVLNKVITKESLFKNNK